MQKGIQKRFQVLFLKRSKRRGCTKRQLRGRSTGRIAPLYDECGFTVIRLNSQVPLNDSSPPRVFEQWGAFYLGHFDKNKREIAIRIEVCMVHDSGGIR